MVGRHHVLVGSLVLAVLLVRTPAATQTSSWTLALQPAGPSTGIFGRTLQTGDVRIAYTRTPGRSPASLGTLLEFTLFGLTPGAVYSVFLELDPTRPPLSGPVPDCVATDPATGTRAEVYCWTPAARDDAAFTGGQGLDPNGFVADARGNARFQRQLNYDIFQPQVAPVVLRPGVTQTVRVAAAAGQCTGSTEGSFVSRLDSTFMRAFDVSTRPNHPLLSPSFPVRESPGRIRLVRATVRALFILEHLDGVTHGRVIGQGVAGPGDGPCGDHVRRLRGELGQATPRRS